MFPAGVDYALKYVLPPAGRIGGKEVSVGAKQNLIDEANKKLVTETNPSKIAALTAQINQWESEIQTLYQDATDGLYKVVSDAVGIAVLIQDITEQIDADNESRLIAEEDFTEAMGDMLRDGYWSDESYIIGQEQAMYDDALKILEEVAYPEITYTINTFDMSHINGYEDEKFKLNMALRVYDEPTGINDFVHVEKMTECIDDPKQNSI